MAKLEFKNAFEYQREIDKLRYKLKQFKTLLGICPFDKEELKGDQGIQGEQGLQGPPGEKGEKGDTGAQGAQGVAGYTPIKGVDYFDGEQGLKGDKGEQGIQGIQGLTGAKGDKGDVGSQGEKGKDGYTPIKGVDYFDGAKGDKGDKGNTGATGSNGWSPLLVMDSTTISGKSLLKLADWTGGTGTKPTTNVGKWLKGDGTYTAVPSEANDLKGVNGVETENDIKKFIPWGAKGLNNSGNITQAESILDKYFISGNITVIKRFTASTSAYDANFLGLKNNLNDEILVSNRGYTFTILLKKAGTQIFSFTEPSGSVFNGLSKIECFIEVDFDKNEIRLSWSDYTRIFSIPELTQLKDSVFNISTYCIYSYNTIRDWVLLKGLYNFSSRNFLFNDTSLLSYITPEAFNNPNKDYVLETPTSVSFSTKTKNFVNGKASFDNVIDGLNISANPLINFNNSTYDLNKIVTEEFSIDINSGFCSFDRGTTGTLFLLRAINKDTGEITEMRPYKAATKFTLPVGRYYLKIQFHNSADVGFRIYLKDLSTDFNVTIYNDLVRKSASIIQCAIPELMTPTQMYDPVQNKIYNGFFKLINNY